MSHIQYKAVIFDLGGVLVTDIWEPLRDWLVIQCGVERSALEEFGKSVVWGYEFACSSDHKYDSELYQRLIQHFGLNVSTEDLIKKAGHFTVPIPGMRDILDKLSHRGFVPIICSNNNEFWFRRQSQALNFPLNDKQVILSCRVHKKKPDDKMFDAAVQASGTTAKECVFVDDRLPNVIAAIKKGMTGIHFPEASESGHLYLQRILDGLGLL
jgi:HAD superfamily hydrolase (TIGR01509 family)